MNNGKAVAWRAVPTKGGRSPQVTWIALPVSKWAEEDAAAGLCTIEYAYASCDAKPAAEVRAKYGDPAAFAEHELVLLVDVEKLPIGTKLYADSGEG